MKSPKKWALSVLAMTLCLLILAGGFTAVIDPVFHYHKPLPGLSYYIWDERYQNDGIIRHFDYNAIITGTSTSENFRPSEMDALFAVQTVKVPFSGTSLREIGDNLRRAFAHRDGIEMVLMGLDGNNLFEDPNLLRKDEPLPEYLYDDNLFNDVSYVLNKDILLRYTMMVLQQTYYGNETTTMDNYAYWWGTAVPGAEAVIGGVDAARLPDPPRAITQEEAQRVRENIRQNIVALAQANPDTTFYLYFTPYSIAYWYQQYMGGNLQRQTEAYRIASEELLRCDNIRLFSYLDYWEWTQDLDQYSDACHHSDTINSLVLQEIHAGRGELTAEGNDARWAALEAYLLEFDFETWLAGLQ